MCSIQNFQTVKNNRDLTITLIILTFLVFVIEIVTPPVIATSIAYVFVVLLCYFDSGYKKIYFFSALCVTLVATDYFFIHNGAMYQAEILANRLISVSCIIMAAVFTINFKNLAQKHQDSAVLLKSILSSANESVMVVNEKGKIIYNNGSAVKMFGFEDFDLIGKQLEDLVQDEFKDKQFEFKEKIKSLQNNRLKGAGTEIKAKRKDGTEFPADISLSNFKTKEGAFFTCFIMDISVRKDAEAEIKRKKEELEKSENFLNSIIKNLPLHILVRESENMSIVLENKQMHEIMGCCDYDPNGNSPAGMVCDCITQEQAERVLSADSEAIETGKTVIIPEFRMVSQTGQESVLRLVKAPIFDPTGKAKYLINICEDITSRVMTQSELKKKNELLMESQEIGNVGSFESDLSYRTITLSKEMMLIAGIEPRDSYPFNTLMDYIHPEDRERVNKALKSTITDNKLCDEKYRIIRPDGHNRHVWLKAKTIYDEFGKPLYLRGVLSDITELKKAEESLKEYIAGLKQMMFMTSHKVRLPIANIIGISNILEQSVNSSETLKKLVDYLRFSAQSLDIFTKELTVYMEHFKTDRES
ncbi:MAG: PAS domain S-box protein [Bacteroidia bacterium]